MQEFEDDEEDSEYDEEVDSDEEEIKEELEDLKNDSEEDEDEQVYGGSRAERRPDNDEEAEIIGADEDIEEVKVGVKRQR